VWGGARESILSAAFLQYIVIRNTCEQDQTEFRKEFTLIPYLCFLLLL